MNNLEKTKELITAYFNSNKCNLENDYQWTFNELTLSRELVLSKNTEFNFIGENCYKRNIELKTQLNALWIEASFSDRIILANYYVKVWGGVKTNRLETINEYVRILDEGLPFGIKGIASWSKIAAIANPSENAIFDARVSFSLNALQLIKLGKINCFFPNLPGRNTGIEKAKKVIRDRFENRIVEIIKYNECYVHYIEIIKHAAGGNNISSVEMLLFAKADELAKIINSYPPEV